jgi:hypothetical protein
MRPSAKWRPRRLSQVEISADDPLGAERLLHEIELASTAISASVDPCSLRDPSHSAEPSADADAYGAERVENRPELAVREPAGEPCRRVVRLDLMRLDM